MKYLNLRETRNFLALVIFFSGGLLWTGEFITVRNTWDSITLHLLIMMNGLGLIMVVVMGTQRIRSRMAEAKASLPTKLPRSTGKCG